MSTHPFMARRARVVKQRDSRTPPPCPNSRAAERTQNELFALNVDWRLLAGAVGVNVFGWIFEFPEFQNGTALVRQAQRLAIQEMYPGRQAIYFGRSISNRSRVVL